MTQSTYQKIALTGNITLNWPFSFQEGQSISDINDISTLQVQIPCYAATTANLVALYSAGTAGVGATLTNNGTQEAFSIDGIFPTTGTRVLVKNQTTFSNWHGIYTVTNSGNASTNWVLTRATDYDNATKIKAGDIIPVTNGDTNANTRWVQTANVSFVIGFGSLTFISKNNGWTITLPDATLASPGQNILFNNVSTNPFQIMNNDGLTSVATILAGQSYYLYLSDTTTTNGIWSPIPFGGGSTAINSMEVKTNGETLLITNGSLTPPGGKIIVETAASISNLVSNVKAPGILILDSLNPSTYNTRTLIGSTNIVVENGDGVSGNISVSLSENVGDLTSIIAGNLQLSGKTITSNADNGSIAIKSVGTGKVNINNVEVDTSSNITGINNLTLNGSLSLTGSVTAGSFSSPTTPKVIFNFTDNSVPVGNKIVELNQYNVASIAGSNGTYTITFTTPLASSNYTVALATGSNGGTPNANHVYCTLKTTTALTLAVIDASGVLVSNVPYGVSGVIYLPT